MKTKVIYDNINNFFIIDERVLLITSNHFVKERKDIIDILRERVKDLVIYSSVSTNPTLAMVEEAIKIFNKNHCTRVVALGGGSVMDVSKAVSLFNSIPLADIWEYYCKTKSIDQITKPVPLIVIPTTFGTGTENNIYSVISYKNEKRSICSEKIRPELCFIDLELSKSLPERQVILNSFDCLMHAVECFISNKSNKKSKRLSIECIKQIIDSYHFDDGKIDFEALSLASHLSGQLESMSSCVSLHSLGHSLSSLDFSILHGESILILAKRYFEIQEVCNPKIMDELNDLLNENFKIKNIKDMVDKYSCKYYELNIEKTNNLVYSFYKIDKQKIIEKAKKLSKFNDCVFPNDLVQLTDEQLLDILDIEFVNIEEQVLKYIDKNDIIYINSNSGIGSHDTDIYCVKKSSGSETHCFYNEKGKWVEMFIDSLENINYKIETTDALGINYASMLNYYCGDKEVYMEIYKKCMQKKEAYQLYDLDELLLMYRIQISYEKISPKNHEYTNKMLYSALIYPFISLLLGKYHTFPASPRNWLTQLESAMGDDFKDLECLFDGKYDYEKLGKLIEKYTKRLDKIDINYIGKNRRSRVE